MYACATGMVEPPIPPTIRERNSVASDPALANTRYAAPLPTSPRMRTGRRPTRSEIRPQIGAMTS